MTAGRRWLVVAVGIVAMIVVPLGWRALPSGDSDATAAELLADVAGADGVGYSGYAESLGTLQLPVTDNFTDVGALFGERTRMRVWWRSDDDWRVDKLLTSGEEDYIHEAGGDTVWNYEKAEARRTRTPDVRLPQPADVLPPRLAALLLDGASAEEVSRLPTRTVAGIDAPGIRLTPAAPQSSISRVDVWLDEESGLPLRVEVTAKGESDPAVTSEFMAVDIAMPAPGATDFSPPPGTDVQLDDALDIADAANQFADVRLLGTVAGLPRDRRPGLGGVGLYGQGATRLVAIPLWDGPAEQLREQLLGTPGVEHRRAGDAIAVGPLNVILTRGPGGSGWLLVGTVTSDALNDAARGLRFVVRDR